jgi:hypothetical protein
MIEVNDMTRIKDDIPPRIDEIEISDMDDTEAMKVTKYYSHLYYHIMPGASTKAMWKLIEVFPTLYELCEAMEQDIFIALHGISARRAHKIYKDLTADRKKFYIDIVDDLLINLYDKYYDGIDEQALKSIVIGIQSLDVDKATKTLSRVIKYVAEQAKDQSYENGRDSERGDGYWET